jgi:hypothetical protein
MRRKLFFGLVAILGSLQGIAIASQEAVILSPEGATVVPT